MSKVKRILISTSLTNIVVIFLIKPSSEMKFLLLSEEAPMMILRSLSLMIPGKLQY